MNSSNHEPGHSAIYPQLTLRETIDDDLPIFFQHQLDPVANHMAAFTAKDPSNREAFMAHWTKIRNMDSVLIRTILVDNVVVGSVLKYEDEGHPEVSYWLGREHWGKGFATQALRAFLEFFPVRPVFARASKDNIASLRVLEKCGFALCGESRGFANARGEEIEEVILILKDFPAQRSSSCC